MTANGINFCILVADSYYELEHSLLDNEKEWLQLLISGDEEAFKKIYASYQGVIYAFALRLTKDNHTAEEVVQEVFIKLWEKKGQINVEKNFDAYPV